MLGARQAFAEPSPDRHHNTGSLIWNDQTALAQAEPEALAKTCRARASLFRASLDLLDRSEVAEGIRSR